MKTQLQTLVILNCLQDGLWLIIILKTLWWTTTGLMIHHCVIMNSWVQNQLNLPLHVGHGPQILLFCLLSFSVHPCKKTDIISLQPGLRQSSKYKYLQDDNYTKFQQLTNIALDTNRRLKWCSLIGLNTRPKTSTNLTRPVWTVMSPWNNNLTSFWKSDWNKNQGSYLQNNTKFIPIKMYISHIVIQNIKICLNHTS